MLLEAELNQVQARKLKRMVAAMSGINDFAKLSISKSRIILEAMNPEHNIPATLVLNHQWFQAYAYNGHSYLFSFTIDFENFNQFLGLAHFQDQVEIIITIPYNGASLLRLMFSNQDGGNIRTHEMNIQRAQNLNFDELLDRSLRLYLAVGIKIPARLFTPTLQYSITNRQSLVVYVTRRMAMIGTNAKEAEQLLSLYTECDIQNLLRDRKRSLEVSLYESDYILRAVQEAQLVMIRPGNRELEPTMTVLFEALGSALLLFDMPFTSIAQPVVPRCL